MLKSPPCVLKSPPNEHCPLLMGAVPLLMGAVPLLMGCP